MNNLIAQAAATPPDHSTRFISLTQGKVTAVDAVDFDWLNQWKWCANYQHGLWYAVRSTHGKHTERKRIRMHRLIMDASTNTQVDHEDGDGLNNRRSNLRFSTQLQNTWNKRRGRRNTSGFKGVSWHSRDLRWIAHVGVNFKLMHLGYFATAEEAARAYDKAAREHFGEFANLNFPA